MRILILTDYFPQTDAGDITGGVEARCFYIKKYIKKHQIRIISLPPGKWSYSSWKSIPMRIINSIRMVIKAFFTDFDVIEGTSFTNHLVAALVGKVKKKPIVCWYADVFAGSWLKLAGSVGIFGEIAERLLFTLPGINYIAISNTTKNKLVNFGVDPQKIKVVYCGVEFQNIKSGKKYEVCDISRMLPYKQLDRLIMATKNIKTVIVGKGPEEKKLKKLAGPKVTFLKDIPSHKEIFKILSQSKIFCHPSLVEGFGIVVIEAMSLGLPVVVADIPIMREITKNGKGALFYKPYDTMDLKNKICLLLNDRALFVKKSQEATEVSKSYNWRKISKQTEVYYENLFIN